MNKINPAFKGSYTVSYQELMNKDPKKLDESLDFVVTKTVNQVGVNINTASQLRV